MAGRIFEVTCPFSIYLLLNLSVSHIDGTDRLNRWAQMGSNTSCITRAMPKTSDAGDGIDLFVVVGSEVLVPLKLLMYAESLLAVAVTSNLISDWLNSTTSGANHAARRTISSSGSFSAIILCLIPL